MNEIHVEQKTRIVAYLTFGEEAFEYADMNYGGLDSKTMESIIFLGLKKAGIEVEDRDAFLKSVGEYTEQDGELDYSVLSKVDLPDVEEVFSEIIPE